MLLDPKPWVPLSIWGSWVRRTDAGARPLEERLLVEAMPSQLHCQNLRSQEPFVTRLDPSSVETSTARLKRADRRIAQCDLKRVRVLEEPIPEPRFPRGSGGL